MDLEEVTPVVDANSDQWILCIMTQSSDSMPELPFLLDIILVNLRDLPADLPQDWTSEVLKDYPQLVQELSQGWQERSFARVRGMIIEILGRKNQPVAFPELSEDPEALQRIPLLSNDEIEQEDHEHDLSLINSFDGKVPSPLSHLLVLILVDERMRTLEHRDAQALLEKHPVLEKALLHMWQQKSFRRIRELAILRLPDVSSIIMAGPQSFEDQQMKATEAAWKQNYVGNAVEGLTVHIERFYQPGHQGGLHQYANYAAIVQSSGTGKSRLVDEFAKKNLVIRMNFRNDTSTGFPPSDRNVRDFFLHSGDRNALYWRSYAFLVSLFRSTHKKVLQIKVNKTEMKTEEIAAAFREFMIAGQTFQQQGSARTAFFDDVVKEAQKILETEDLSSRMGKVEGEPPDKTSLFKEMIFKDAVALANIIKEKPRRSHQYHTRGKKITSYDFPVIFLEFDEAHPLTTACINETKHTHFSELRRALRMMHEAPVFSLFLSTTGKISQFNPHRAVDPSARVMEGNLHLIPPYSDLGFDQLMAGYEVGDGEKTIAEVTGFPFMSHLGRPLFGSRWDAFDLTVRETILAFAMMKLINAQLPKQLSVTLSDVQKLACLAARLPIDFNSTTYVGQSQEHTQVECHMRVCLNVDESFETMKTIFPSEPLLAEAAAEFMRNPEYNFKAPAALKNTLTGFSINKGDRGELLVLLLLCLARDAALRGTGKAVTVYDFMQELFPNLINKSNGGFMPSVLKKGAKPKTFKDCFDKSYIYFNHFIKINEWSVLNQKYLWRLFLRGAAVLCANGQEGVDALIPILFQSETIGEYVMGFIVVQIKNDARFGANPELYLFDNMHPFKLNIFNKGREALPILRIVFAVGSHTPGLQRPKNPEASKNSEFTSYDFWCAGLSEKHLGPITKDEESTWDALRQASRGWKDIYKAEAPRAALRRAACAGSATHPDHWRNFTKDVPGVPGKRKREAHSDADGRRNDGDSDLESGPKNMPIQDEDLAESNSDVVMGE